MKEEIPNSLITGTFLIRDVEHRTASNQSKFTSFSAIDKEVRLSCKRWGEHLPFNNGDVYELTMRANEYRGQIQYILESWQTSAVSPLDLIPGLSAEETEFYWGRLLSIALSITDEIISEMVTLTVCELEDVFKIAPAAKMYHHAYRGGLLFHTLEVATLAETMAALFLNDKRTERLIDRDVVIAGAILHDLGKVWGYDLVSGEYTKSEALIGHIVNTVSYLETQRYESYMSERESPPNVPKIVEIMHCILSHHGALEYGSPVIPKTPEAIIIHFADMVSSRIGMIEKTEVLDGWTEYIRPLGTAVYLGDKVKKNV